MKFEEISWENVTVEAYNSKLKEHKILLHDVSGRFEAGKLSVIMGPSGSGKTTFINTLSGNIPNEFKTSGRIRLDKMPRPSNFSEYVGLYYQDDIYFDYYTIFNYLYFNSVGRQRDKSKVEIIAKINEILEKLHLTKRRDNLLSDISGGERKRVMIARELLSNNPILFFDEATSNLDSHLALDLVHYLKEWAIKENTIMLISIHQPSEAITSLFDYFIFLNQGKAIYQGNFCDVAGFLNERGFERPEFLSMSEYLFELTSENTRFKSIEQESKRLTELMCKDAESPKNSNNSEQIIQYHFSFRVFYEVLKRIIRSWTKPIKRRFVWIAVICYVLYCGFLVYLKSEIIDKISDDDQKASLIQTCVNKWLSVGTFASFNGNIDSLVKPLSDGKLLQLETSISCYSPVEFVSALLLFGIFYGVFTFLLCSLPLYIVIGLGMEVTSLIKGYILPLLWLFHINLVLALISPDVFIILINYMIGGLLVFAHYLYMYFITFNELFRYFFGFLNVIANSFGIAPLIHLYFYYSDSKSNMCNIALILSNIVRNSQFGNSLLRNVFATATENYAYFLSGLFAVGWLTFFKFSFLLYLIPSTWFTMVFMKKRFGTPLRYELEK